MRINIVNYELAFQNTGILSKYSYCLEREANKLGVSAYVTALPDNRADITHHINYLAFQPTTTLNTLMITHITGDLNHTRDFKLSFLKKSLETSFGITMSKSMISTLIEEGISPEKLACVYHAQDSLPRRPIRIAILHNIYPDGRKREWMYKELFKTIDPSKFEFLIVGTGWQGLLKDTTTTIKISYIPKFGILQYKSILDIADFVLGTGDEDCANQSHLDALQAGVKTIFPRIDAYIELGVDFPFSDQSELNEIFKKLSYNKVEEFTWENYARKHIAIWEGLL